MRYTLQKYLKHINESLNYMKFTVKSVFLLILLSSIVLNSSFAFAQTPDRRQKQNQLMQFVRNSMRDLKQKMREIDQKMQDARERAKRSQQMVKEANIRNKIAQQQAEDNIKRQRQMAEDTSRQAKARQKQMQQMLKDRVSNN